MKFHDDPSALYFTDEELKKLPAWSRFRIKELQQRSENLAEINNRRPKSNVWFYQDARTSVQPMEYLPKGTAVTFELEPGNRRSRIAVRIFGLSDRAYAKPFLQVISEDSMSIFPQNGNSVRIVSDVSVQNKEKKIGEC